MNLIMIKILYSQTPQRQFFFTGKFSANRMFCVSEPHY